MVTKMTIAFVFSLAAVLVAGIFILKIIKGLKNWMTYEKEKSPMTQEEAEKIMATVGESILYVCSDKEVFLSYHEALVHSESLLNKEVSTYIKQE